jgi:glyoxalase superfamily protein
MASGRVQVTFDCSNPEALATFWAAVLGYPPPDLEAFHARLRSLGIRDEDLSNCCRIEDPDGERPRLFFQRVPEPKVSKNRVHLDVGASPRGSAERDEIDAEVARIVELGGRVLRSVADETGYFTVMQDPEGNEFCVD